MTLGTKRPNKKQKSRTDITYITNQYFSKLLNNFNNLTYIGYKKKQAYNEPTEAYLFLIKHIYKLIKSKKHIYLCTKKVKSDTNGTKHANETIEHVNKKIQSIITLMNG